MLRLAQEGKLSLDDSIAVLLPGVPEHSRAITVRQLLSHTSGVPRANAQGRGDDLAAAVAQYLGEGPRGEPGERFEYWNGGYALLAGVIERASGLSYVEYMERHVLAPSGMSASGFTGGADLAPGLAALGSSASGRPRTALEHPYRDYGYQYRGMGGLVTSVNELARWDRALAGHAVLDEARTAQLFAPVDGGYALGWRIERAADGGVRQSHGGSVRGFVSEVRRLPGRDACVAVLCNSDDADPRAIADGLEELLCGRKASAGTGREPLSRAQLEALAGSYACEAGRLVVRAAPGVLIAGLEGERLIAKAGGAGELDWKADADELSKRATLIVEGIARGDTEPLRTHMAKRIPASWPDTMRRAIWPAQLERRGAFHGARPLGALARADRLEVLLALEHDKGPARALVAFGPAGLELLDWDGPQFLVAARLEPLRADAFRLLVGERPQRLEFELVEGVAREARLAGLVLERQ